MSVLNPSAGEVFTARVYKNLDIAVDRAWANTYELRASDGAGYSDLVAAANALVTFEQGMCHDTVRFNRVVLSTYVEDGAPYDPLSFISIPLTQIGVIGSPIAAEVLPLQVALYVRRDVPTGRTGKLFLRQTVGEGDVSGRYGTFSLTTPAALSDRLDDALSASGLDEYFEAGTAPLKLVMASGSSPVVFRPITGFTVVDARLIKFNNRYFDRVMSPS